MPPTEAGTAALVAACAAMGGRIDEAAAEQILRFRDMLVRWNRVYNLTSVRSPSDMWAQHLLDSLSLLGPLDRHAAGRNLRVLDVGSGGGLPGAVLAIARPHWAVTTVDAVAKKASFVRQVALELAVSNLEALHGRVESIPGQCVDVVVSRAFASLADFVSLTRAHLALTGIWVAMKGKRPDDEIAAMPADVQVFHVEPLVVPELVAERHLIWVCPGQSEIPSALGRRSP